MLSILIQNTLAITGLLGYNKITINGYTVVSLPNGLQQASVFVCPNEKLLAYPFGDNKWFSNDVQNKIFFEGRLDENNEVEFWIFDYEVDGIYYNAIGTELDKDLGGVSYDFVFISSIPINYQIKPEHLKIKLNGSEKNDLSLITSTFMHLEISKYGSSFSNGYFKVTTTVNIKEYPKNFYQWSKASNYDMDFSDDLIYAGALEYGKTIGVVSHTNFSILVPANSSSQNYVCLVTEYDKLYYEDGTRAEKLIKLQARQFSKRINFYTKGLIYAELKFIYYDFNLGESSNVYSDVCIDHFGYVLKNGKRGREYYNLYIVGSYPFDMDYSVRISGELKRFAIRNQYVHRLNYEFLYINSLLSTQPTSLSPNSYRYKSVDTQVWERKSELKYGIRIEDSIGEVQIPAEGAALVFNITGYSHYLAIINPTEFKNNPRDFYYDRYTFITNVFTPYGGRTKIMKYVLVQDSLDDVTRVHYTVIMNNIGGYYELSFYNSNRYILASNIPMDILITASQEESLFINNVRSEFGKRFFISNQNVCKIYSYYNIDRGIKIMITRHNISDIVPSVDTQFIYNRYSNMGDLVSDGVKYIMEVDYYSELTFNEKIHLLFKKRLQVINLEYLDGSNQNLDIYENITELTIDPQSANAKIQVYDSDGFIGNYGIISVPQTNSSYIIAPPSNESCYFTMLSKVSDDISPITYGKYYLLNNTDEVKVALLKIAESDSLDVVIHGYEYRYYLDRSKLEASKQYAVVYLSVPETNLHIRGKEYMKYSIDFDSQEIKEANKDSKFENLNFMAMYFRFDENYQDKYGIENAIDVNQKYTDSYISGNFKFGENSFIIKEKVPEPTKAPDPTKTPDPTKAPDPKPSTDLNPGKYLLTLSKDGQTYVVSKNLNIVFNPEDNNDIEAVAKIGSSKYDVISNNVYSIDFYEKGTLEISGSGTVKVFVFNQESIPQAEDKISLVGTVELSIGNKKSKDVKYVLKENQTIMIFAAQFSSKALTKFHSTNSKIIIIVYSIDGTKLSNTRRVSSDDQYDGPVIIYIHNTASDDEEAKVTIQNESPEKERSFIVHNEIGEYKSISKESKPNNSSKAAGIVIGVILLLAVIAAAAYFAYWYLYKSGEYEWSEGTAQDNVENEETKQDIDNEKTTEFDSVLKDYQQQTDGAEEEDFLTNYEV